MAKVLAVLTSARSKGWTSQLLDKAIEGLESVGIEVEKINLHKFKIEPCIACFNCIRSEEHVCTKKDDMGGDGKLYEKIINSNGLIIADPVFLWGSTALARVFVERMYPFIWNGIINGMPFGSITCASNSGFQYQAGQDIAKQVFNIGFRYMGSVPVHASYFNEGLMNAEILGKEIGLKALEDEKGRVKLKDIEKFEIYGEPWNVVDAYLANLTNGSMKYEDSMPYKALKNEVFCREEAIVVLKKADEKIKNAFIAMGDNDIEKVMKELSDGSALWTEATWREFLEEKVIGVKKPKTYRPVDELMS